MTSLHICINSGFQEFKFLVVSRLQVALQSTDPSFQLCVYFWRSCIYGPDFIGKNGRWYSGCSRGYNLYTWDRVQGNVCGNIGCIHSFPPLPKYLSMISGKLTFHSIACVHPSFANTIRALNVLSKPPVLQHVCFEARLCAWAPQYLQTFAFFPAVISFDRYKMLFWYKKIWKVQFSCFLMMYTLT